jgi:hypothetical protein
MDMDVMNPLQITRWKNIKVDDINSKATVRKKGALKGSNKRGYNC